MKTNLKVVLSAVALAAFVAAPAVAKTRTQQTTQPPAFNAVVQDGKVVGADPDAYIRHEILRDNSSYHAD